MRKMILLISAGILGGFFMSCSRVPAYEACAAEVADKTQIAQECAVYEYSPYFENYNPYLIDNWIFRDHPYPELDEVSARRELLKEDVWEEQTDERNINEPDRTVPGTGD